MTVTATVQASCMVTATNLAFGAYTGVQDDNTATITVLCSNGTSYYVNLDNGLQSSCCWSNNMTNGGGGRLNYLLYQDSARSKVWQNTIYSDGIAGTGSGAGQTLIVYGRLFAGQYVAPGVYNDTITATLHY